MRVAILTVEFPPTIFGGTGTFLQNLATALSKQGTEVVIITGTPERYPTRKTTTEGMEVVRFPREPLLPRHFWFQIRSMDSIKKELSTCDVIHGQDCVSFPILNVCKKSGIHIPWVVTFHTNPLSELYAIAHRGASILDYVSYLPGFPLWDMTDRIIPKAADQPVAVSSSLRVELCRTYGLERKAMKVIHTCINLADFEKFKNNRGTVTDKKIQLFFAGRLYYRKGISHLLRIMASMTSDHGETDFELQIFGRGPLESSLKHYVSRHNLNGVIRFRGHVTRDTLLENMNQCDIVCFPSLYEACPLLMMEGMAMGKPVAAFDLPFSREMMGKEHRSLLASDEQDFAMKLRLLMQSKSDREKLGHSLQRKAKAFDANIIAKAYSDVYTHMLG